MSKIKCENLPFRFSFETRYTTLQVSESFRGGERNTSEVEMRVVKIEGLPSFYSPNTHFDSTRMRGSGIQGVSTPKVHWSSSPVLRFRKSTTSH